MVLDLLIPDLWLLSYFYKLHVLEDFKLFISEFRLGNSNESLNAIML